MDEKKRADNVNDIYDKIEQNRQKYLDLMAEEGKELENAIKLNHKLNERTKKLGIQTCVYKAEEDNNGED